MSVCIHIKGFDGKWWQGKTILCIQNKRNPSFRWQRLAVFCIRFFQNKESGCKPTRIKTKTCIQKQRKQMFWWQRDMNAEKNPGAGICSSGSRVCNQVRVLSEALLAHGVGNLLEAGDICTLDVVNVSVRALAFLDAVVVDVLHDDMKLLIDLFC